MTKTALTLFGSHVIRWQDCTRCHLHEVRRKVVLARGKVPCDLLFLGEAPGHSEDAIGLPFVGPAGHLLNSIIKKSVPITIRYAMTNLVACIPLDEDGDKTSEPDDDCVKACNPRLQEFVRICDPKLIVCVGKLARDWLDPGYKHSIKFFKEIPRIDIVHPASILRANIAQKGLMVQRCVVTLRNAVEEYLL